MASTYGDILDWPAAAPPKGAIPFNPHDPTLEIDISLQVLFMVIITASFSIRLYTNLILLRKKIWHEFALVIAFGVTMGLLVTTIARIRENRYHQWDMTLRQLFRCLRSFQLGIIFYSMIVCFLKIAILLQIQSLFIPNRKYDKLLWFTIQSLIGTLSVFYFVSMMLAIFLCQPRDAFWNKLVTGKCLNFGAYKVATGCFNVFSDFVILALPMPSIWRLQMPLKKKLILTGVFASGLLACIASVVRTYESARLIENSDVIAIIRLITIWAWAEITIGFFICAVTSFPKFFTHCSSVVSSFISASIAPPSPEPPQTPVKGSAIPTARARVERMSEPCDAVPQGQVEKSWVMGRKKQYVPSYILPFKKGGKARFTWGWIECDAADERVWPRQTAEVNESSMMEEGRTRMLESIIDKYEH